MDDGDSEANEKQTEQQRKTVWYIPRHFIDVSNVLSTLWVRLPFQADN